MKKLTALLLALVLLTACAAAFAEADGWTCPECGKEASGNFCSECGAKRPEEETEAEAPEGKIRLDLDIAFEKNAYFSTYDAKLLLDGEETATLKQGGSYTETLWVEPGTHFIVFREVGSSPAEGSTALTVTEPTRYSCVLHAKMNTILIRNEKTETIPEDRPEAGGEKLIGVNGDLRLKVNVEFRKNAIFSTYAVDLFLDDVFVETLPHGMDFSATLLVSPGEHMLIFCKAGNHSIRGTHSFRIAQDAELSCRIEAERNRVDVRNTSLR